MKINISDCMHPGDLAAMNTIKSIPKFQQLLDFISSSSFEKFYKLCYYASNIKITRENSPLIFDILDEAVEIFDIEEKHIPEIFIERSYDYHVNIYGIKEPIMVISTAVLKNLSPEELRLYLIPYIASVAAGHNTMNFIKLLVDNYASILPFPKEIFQLPIYHWSKQKEYTYDRIRLILSNDLEKTAKFIGIGETTKEIMLLTGLENRLETSKKVADYNMPKTAVRNLQAIGSNKATNASRLIDIFNWSESGAHLDLINNSDGEER